MCCARSMPAFGGVTVLPVHSKAGEPAIRVLVRAAKASRAPLALLPGLVLNDDAGASDRAGRSGAARRRRTAVESNLNAPLS